MLMRSRFNSAPKATGAAGRKINTVKKSHVKMLSNLSFFTKQIGLTPLAVLKYNSGHIRKWFKKTTQEEEK